jgi:hypothetical protein
MHVLFSMTSKICSFAAVLALIVCSYTSSLAQLADPQQQQQLMKSTDGNITITTATVKTTDTTTKPVPVGKNANDLIIYLESRNNTHHSRRRRNGVSVANKIRQRENHQSKIDQKRMDNACEIA